MRVVSFSLSVRYVDVRVNRSPSQEVVPVKKTRGRQKKEPQLDEDDRSVLWSDVG